MNRVERFRDHSKRSFDVVLGDTNSFSEHIDYVRARYETVQRDVKGPQEWDLEELKDDLYFEDLPERTQVIFDDLVSGQLTDKFKAYRFLEITVLEEDVYAMTSRQIRILALERLVVGLAARIYLARLIDTKGYTRSLRYQGDIVPKYWHEVGQAYGITRIARDGFDGRSTAADFVEMLNRSYQIEIC